MDFNVYFAGLANLQLRGKAFVLSSHRPLASLRSLSLDYPSIVAVPSLLEPALVPALTAFGLRWIMEEPDLPEHLQKKTSIARLLPQLDAVSLDIEVYSFMRWTLYSNLAARILVDCDWRELFSFSEACSTACHLRIGAESDGKGDPIAVSELLDYLKLIEHTCLRSIYLDTSLRFLGEPIEKLIGVCAERKIELVFEAQPKSYRIDQNLSPEFCQRQRKERINELAQGGYGGV